MYFIGQSSSKVQVYTNVFARILQFIFSLRDFVYKLTFVLFVSTKCCAIDFKMTEKKNQECCSKEGKEWMIKDYLINTL